MFFFVRFAWRSTILVIFVSAILIPDEGYCDQPYVVTTKNGNWLCVLTTGPGEESQKHQHVVATISSDNGKTWCEPIDIEPGRSPDWRMSSWAVPLVVPSGWVYVFYNYDGDKIRKRPNGKRPASAYSDGIAINTPTTADALGRNDAIACRCESPRSIETTKRLARQGANVLGHR